MTIMCERNKLGLEGNLKSDCASLNSLVDTMLEAYEGIHVIRDATRGGVAAVLNEISEFSNVTIALEENNLPLKEEVKGATEMLGLIHYILLTKENFVLLYQKLTLKRYLMQ